MPNDLYKLQLFPGEEPASKQAFSRSRQQISKECFQKLHQQGIEVYYSDKKLAEKSLWNGIRIIAADSSTLRLPESEELAQEFGRCNTAKNTNCSRPMARISEFMDMSTRLVINGRIAPYSVSEEVLAKEQLPEVVECMRKLGQEELLFVYDRGYPSDEFISEHIKLGVHFIFRVPKNFNTSISNVYEEGIPDSDQEGHDEIRTYSHRFSLYPPACELLTRHH